MTTPEVDLHEYADGLGLAPWLTHSQRAEARRIYREAQACGEGHKGLATWAYDNWEDDPA